MQAPAEVDEGDLFRVPSSFARDIGDLQVSGWHPSLLMEVS